MPELLQIDDIRHFFLERHILLKNDWLAAAASYVSQKCRTKEQVTASVFHQWTLSSIDETSEPILHTLRSQLSGRHYALAIVLQVLRLAGVIWT